MEGRSMDVDWQTDLDCWLAPFVAALRHKTRARMCPVYIAGLIGPGDRKSVQPMATRDWRGRLRSASSFRRCRSLGQRPTRGRSSEEGGWLGRR